MENTINLSLLDGVLSEYAEVKGSLITILQHTQEIYGYLPKDRDHGRRDLLHAVPF